MECGHCATMNRPKAKVCTRCGRRLLHTLRADDPEGLFGDKTDPNLRVKTANRLVAGVVFVMCCTVGVAAGLLCGEHPYGIVPLALFIFVYVGMASLDGSSGLPRALASGLAGIMQRLRSMLQPMLGTSLGILLGMIINNVRMVPPPSIEEAQDDQRSQIERAGGDFPKRLPIINAQLSEASRLLDISKVAAADAQLAAIEESLQPVLNSSYRNFADVLDVQKRLAVVKARAAEAHGEVELAGQRRKLAQVGKQLDEVDECLRNRRFGSAGKVWAWQQSTVAKLSHPALLASQDWADTQKRMTQQKTWITAGMSGHPLPMAEIMPKKKSKARRTYYSSMPP